MTGTILGIQFRCTLLASGSNGSSPHAGSFLNNVPGSEIVFVHAYKRGDVVIYQGWMGVIKSCTVQHAPARAANDATMDLSRSVTIDNGIDDGEEARKSSPGTETITLNDRKAMLQHAWSVTYVVDWRRQRKEAPSTALIAETPPPSVHVCQIAQNDTKMQPVVYDLDAVPTDGVRSHFGTDSLYGSNTPVRLKKPRSVKNLFTVVAVYGTYIVRWQNGTISKHLGQSLEPLLELSDESEFQVGDLVLLAPPKLSEHPTYR